MHGASTEKQVQQQGKRNAASLKKATAVSDIVSKVGTMETRVENMKKALKEIQGTGLTQAQKSKSSLKEAVKKVNSESTRKWKRETVKGLYGTKYTQYNSGDYTISTSDGVSSIYYKNDAIAHNVSSLATAKALVETYEKRRKK